MIAERFEPKGLDKNTPPLGHTERAMNAERRAKRGSARLRDAMRHSLGLSPWPIPPKPRVRPAPLVREMAHIPQACIHCGAPAKPAGMLIAHIQHTVAAYYRLEPATMISAQRGQAIAHPRQIAMYLASALTPKSLPEIGRRFGGRDHTTVIHAIKAVKARMETDAEIFLDVEMLRERLEG